MKLKFISYCLSGLVLLFLAPILGPHSCEGGLAAYLLAGILFFLLSAVLPFVKNPAAVHIRLFQALGLAVIAVSLWISGFVLGDFRILCRLF